MFHFCGRKPFPKHDANMAQTPADYAAAWMFILVYAIMAHDNGLTQPVWWWKCATGQCNSTLCGEWGNTVPVIKKIHDNRHPNAIRDFEAAPRELGVQPDKDLGSLLASIMIWSWQSFHGHRQHQQGNLAENSRDRASYAHWWFRRPTGWSSTAFQ